jgi:hypothetical protein
MLNANRFVVYAEGSRTQGNLDLIWPQCLPNSMRRRNDGSNKGYESPTEEVGLFRLKRVR